jgi:hypothetical protein
MEPKPSAGRPGAEAEVDVLPGEEALVEAAESEETVLENPQVAAARDREDSEKVRLLACPTTPPARGEARRIEPIELERSRAEVARL